MFTKKLEQMFEERSNNMNEYIKETQERLNKIEEQLNPPAFEKGDMVNFLLVGQEFEGEIVSKDSWNFPSHLIIDTDKWIINYLDKNEVVQTVSIKEEDIWYDEEDCIEFIHERINGLALRLNKLEGRGTKK